MTSPLHAPEQRSFEPIERRGARRRAPGVLTEDDWYLLTISNVDYSVEWQQQLPPRMTRPG